VAFAPTCTSAHCVPLRAKLICFACYREHACHSSISLQYPKLSTFPPRTVYQDFIRRLSHLRGSAPRSCCHTPVALRIKMGLIGWLRRFVGSWLASWDTVSWRVSSFKWWQSSVGRQRDISEECLRYWGRITSIYPHTGETFCEVTYCLWVVKFEEWRLG